ncbi:hypothetical protein [Enterobacter sp. Bisph1]|uniref:hypothetical protein n=1 Tax=Enterobacter sp. Bisph1 TaxID=1274399 RepID=UPI00057C2653|nr:hypothetical protein [Enterobacter sp. Bisph1]
MRLLTKEDLLINTKKIYFNYSVLRNHEKGICFGSSLFWVTEVLKQAGRNHQSRSMMEIHREKLHNLLVKNSYKFNDYSKYLQQILEANKLYTPLLLNSLKMMVDTLNDQEQQLAFNRSAEESEYKNKLLYTLITGAEAKNEIDEMLQYRDRYENTALIITTKMKRNPTQEDICAHSTVFINYEKSLYFYDPNRGVYAIPDTKEMPFKCSNLLLTLARTFKLDNTYRLSHSLHHIRVQTDIPLEGIAAACQEDYADPRVEICDRVRLLPGNT